MKLTKKTIEDEEVYFENGVKKYTHSKNSDGSETWREFDKYNNVIHYKSSNGFEYWSEYDSNNNEIHYNDSDGDETWSDDNPNNPKNRGVEVDIQPFTFNTEKTMTKTLLERKAEAEEAYDEAREAYEEAGEAYEAILEEIEKEGK